MTAIRVVFDGKAFIPQEPVALPAQTETVVFVENADPSALQHLDEAVRAYYQDGADPEDADWANSIGGDLRRAWDED